MLHRTICASVVCKAALPLARFAVVVSSEGFRAGRVAGTRSTCNAAD